MSSLFATALSNELPKLHQDPNGRLILQSETYWAVLHSLDVPSRGLLELSCNTNLPEDRQLTEAQQQKLTELSFTQRRRKRSLGKLVPISSESHHDALITELAYVFDDVFGVDSNALQISFTPNVRQKLSNKPLLECMKKMSKSKQHHLRIELYKALLNSSLLLLTAESTPDQPLQTGTLMNYPIYTCFTDYESARCYDPRVGQLTEMYAYQIFNLVWSLNVGSLQINPKGDIGGELYRNEIETLIQAVQKTSR